jgi:hypothetical protein
MRLNTTSLTLNFIVGDQILSHRWEDEEVLFQDIRNEVTEAVEAINGYAKVKGSCALARSRGYHYIFAYLSDIDTYGNRLTTHLAANRTLGSVHLLAHWAIPAR